MVRNLRAGCGMHRHVDDFAMAAVQAPGNVFARTRPATLGQVQLMVA